ncbi:Os07g0626650, partial [Oryza sativa Japonica Group]|uniref:Uncharacterized protein n=2 Tax=Oryza TaxID=4527 RepID=I1QCE4_ORYGL
LEHAWPALLGRPPRADPHRSADSPAAAATGVGVGGGLGDGGLHARVHHRGFSRGHGDLRRAAPASTPDPVADGAAAVEAAASSARHQATLLPSFPSLKTWGSDR